MLSFDIPGKGSFDIHTLLCDFNGTLAIDGKLIPGVKERLMKLSQQLSIHVLTADTFATVYQECDGLNLEVQIIGQYNQQEDKREHLLRYDPPSCIAIGNGLNDAMMLREAGLGFCVLQNEGSSVASLLQADVLFPSINDALDALIYPKRLIATLRN